MAFNPNNPASVGFGGITRLMPMNPLTKQQQAVNALARQEADLNFRDKRDELNLRMITGSPSTQVTQLPSAGPMQMISPADFGGNGFAQMTQRPQMISGNRYEMRGSPSGGSMAQQGGLPQMSGSMRPRPPKQKIKGFSRQAAGLPNWGGLEQNALLQGTTNPAFYQGSQSTDPRWSVQEVQQNLAERGIRGYQKGGIPRPGEVFMGNEAGPEAVATPQGLQPLGSGRPALFRAPAAPVEIIPLTDIDRFQGIPNARQARTALRRQFQGSSGAQLGAQLALQEALQGRRDAQEMEGRRELALFNQGLRQGEVAEQRSYEQAQQERLTDEQVGTTLAESLPLLQNYQQRGLLSAQQMQEFAAQKNPRIRASMAKGLIKFGDAQAQQQQQTNEEVTGGKLLPMLDESGNTLGYITAAQQRGGGLKPMGMLGAPEKKVAQPVPEGLRPETFTQGGVTYRRPKEAKPEAVPEVRTVTVNNVPTSVVWDAEQNMFVPFEVGKPIGRAGTTRAAPATATAPSTTPGRSAADYLQGVRSAARK